MFGQRASHGLAAILLTALVVVLPPALALLDAGGDDHRVRVESRHDPGQCEYAHDHTACVLLQHTRAAPDDGWSTRTLSRLARITRPAGRDVPPRPTPGPSLGPRAPPSSL